MRYFCPCGVINHYLSLYNDSDGYRLMSVGIFVVKKGKSAKFGLGFSLVMAVSFAVLLPMSVQAQQTPSSPFDSLYKGGRVFDEVIVVGRFTPMTYEDYWRMKYRIKKVWPYAVLGAQYLQEMDQLRDDLSKRKFKKAVNQRQKELFDNFSGILKKFTRTEGKILIKLIYRQTGVSTYEIAKELKSGFKAFWWNASASMFSLSLKDEYDPRTDAEDYNIETVLRECFASGELAPHPPYNDLSSSFYYRKVEQDIERDRRQAEELDKLEKKRERQLKKRDRRDAD